MRLLVPKQSDVGWIVPLSRSLYRPLLEAGVRIFEWNGTMMHAKTAIADGRWARIGSTNLNLNSWLGNWELDVAIEDEDVSATLSSHFEDDLGRSTEILLRKPVRRKRKPGFLRNPVSVARRRTMRTLAGVGRTLGAAVTGSRPLEDYEIAPVAGAGLALAALAVIAFYAPRLLAWPVAVVAAWVAATLLVEAWGLWRRK